VTGSQPASCVVPTLRGRTLARARTALKAAGCKLGTVKRSHSPVKRGRVIRSTPRAKKVLAAGSRVTVVVSRGRRG
jgi:beta-lactam-binding protein with PASTA domain